MKSALATLLILSVTLLMACTDNPVQTTVEQVSITAEKLKGNPVKVKTKNFKAEFFSSGGLQFDLDPAITEDICGAGPYLLNIQEGYGTGTFIGRFEYYASFCADISNIDIGQVIFFETEKTTQYLATPAGDTLFVPVETGMIGPSEVPGYDLQFTGSVTSSEGTGRLSEVTINATTLGLVILSPERTDHTWTGTIEF